MSLHNVIESIYFSLNPSECNKRMEAMMNIMQATFVVLQLVPSLDHDILSKGHQVFKALYMGYFSEDMKVTCTHIEL